MSPRNSSGMTCLVAYANLPTKGILGTKLLCVVFFIRPEKSTISARNNMTSIFSNFHDEMSDYIDTIGQNLTEISPQPEEEEDSGLMQNMDGEPEDYQEEEDDSEFVNTDMFEG